MTDKSRIDAFRIRRDDSGFESGRRTLTLDELTDGDVVVDVAYSSINYKDALAGSGRGRILRRPELNGGIDLAGHVVASDSDRFAPGDEVFVCGGGGLSETLDGGYATRTRVPASILRRPPPGLALRDTMAIGTAGITAAIALRRLLDNGQPTDRGPIVVTGASGGVGSFAIHLLATAGFEVLASSGKHDSHDYLRSLGAHEVIGRFEGAPAKPLESVRYGGAIDSVGGDTLAQLAAATSPWGSIASVGLAGGTELHTTVMPFILRGVSLLGVNCLEVPEAMVDDCWARLAGGWKSAMLDTIAPHETGLDGLSVAFDAIMAGSVTGRYVVTLG